MESEPTIEVAGETLLSESEVAAQLGLTLRTLQRWRKQGGGRGPHAVQVGKIWRYGVSAIRDWVRGAGARPGDPVA